MKKSLERFKRFEEEFDNLIKKAAEKQHKKKKLTARERIGLLLDKGSFIEIGKFEENRLKEFGLDKKRILSDAVVTGYGTIGGRKVCIFSQDFSFSGGTLGEVHSKKISEIIELAIETGVPIIGIYDSGGARIQEGVISLDAYAKIFRLNVKASGIIPQFSLILGPCAGGASYSPALTDFIFMVKGISEMFITGPGVIKEATGEKVSMEELGSGYIHSKVSGVCHFFLENEKECMKKFMELFSYMPSNYLQFPPKESEYDSVERKNNSLLRIVPENLDKAYDMRDVINELFDRGSFLEVQKEYSPNIIVGFARLGGIAVGVVANQPKFKAGCLDIESSQKLSRFVNFCDSFNFPIINLVDVPGYLPGKNEEHHGIIRHGADILFAYASATVPKISLIIRKAYGGAYIALASKELGFDQVIAWPTAIIAVMGTKEACKILYKKEAEKARNLSKFLLEKQKEYEEKYLNPYFAARVGAIDMIIDPVRSREYLFKILNAILEKRQVVVPKKHGNIPL